MARLWQDGKEMSIRPTPPVTLGYLMMIGGVALDDGLWWSERECREYLAHCGNEPGLEIYSFAAVGRSPARGAVLKDVTAEMVKAAIRSGDLSPDTDLAAAHGLRPVTRDEYEAGRGDADWHRGAA